MFYPSQPSGAPAALYHKSNFCCTITLQLWFLHSFQCTQFLQNLMTNWAYISKTLSTLAIDLMAERIGSVIYGDSVPISFFFISSSFIKWGWRTQGSLSFFVPLFLIFWYFFLSLLSSSFFFSFLSFFCSFFLTLFFSFSFFLSYIFL